MFGSRPEKNDPEIDKLNFWFTLIGPLTINPEKMYFRRKSIFYNIDGPSSNHYYYKLRVQVSSLFVILCIKLNHRILPNIFACHLLQTELKIRKRNMKLRQFTLCILSFCLISHEFKIMSTQNEACTFGPKSPKGSSKGGFYSERADAFIISPNRQT